LCEGAVLSKNAGWVERLLFERLREEAAELLKSDPSAKR
jgi:hypothetical protein